MSFGSGDEMSIPCGESENTVSTRSEGQSSNLTSESANICAGELAGESDAQLIAHARVQAVAAGNEAGIDGSQRSGGIHHGGSASGEFRYEIQQATPRRTEPPSANRWSR